MEFDLLKKYSHRIQINSLKSQRIVHCNCSSNASQKIFSKLITRPDEIKKQRQPHNDRINLRTGVVEDTNRVKQQETKNACSIRVNWMVVSTSTSGRLLLSPLLQSLERLERFPDGWKKTTAVSRTITRLDQVLPNLDRVQRGFQSDEQSANPLWIRLSAFLY